MKRLRRRKQSTVINLRSHSSTVSRRHMTAEENARPLHHRRRTVDSSRNDQACGIKNILQCRERTLCTGSTPVLTAGSILAQHADMPFVAFIPVSALGPPVFAKLRDVCEDKKTGGGLKETSTIFHTNLDPRHKRDPIRSGYMTEERSRASASACPLRIKKSPQTHLKWAWDHMTQCFGVEKSTQQNTTY